MNPPIPPIVARQLRIACVNLLTIVTGVVVASPGATETAPKDIADVGEIKVRAPNERKDSVAKTLPNTTTTTTLEFIARCKGATDTEAQDNIEALVATIETVIFGAPSLITMVQCVASVQRTVEIAEEGEVWYATAQIHVDFETYERWDPTLLTPDNYPDLLTVDIHMDMGVPFDAAQNYPPSAFPASVAPAPRTEGPDGRDEIHASVVFTTAPPPPPPQVRPYKISGKQLLKSTGTAVTVRGWNWGTWGDWQPGDAQAAKDSGANLVRIPLRWWTPVTGTDSRQDNAPGGINPAFLAVLDSMINDCTTVGIPFQLFVDSNCGQDGTQDANTIAFCDPTGSYPNGHNFWSDPAEQDDFWTAWEFLAARYGTNPWWAVCELLPEPGPDPADFDDSDIRDFYAVGLNRLRPLLPGMLFMVGGYKYQSTHIGQSLIPGATDVLFTANTFMPQGGAQADNIASWTRNLGHLTLMRDTNNVCVYSQQTGVTSAQDPDGTYIRSMLPPLNAAGMGWIWWTFRDNAANGFAPIHRDQSGHYTVDQPKLNYIASQLSAPAV